MMEQRLVRITLAVVILTLVVGSAYLAVAAVQSFAFASSRRTINVSGTGSASVSPDQAQVTLGAVTQAESAQLASTANAKIMSAVLANLHSIGITNDSISTVSYYVSPVYSNYQNGQPQQIIAYQVQHTFQVKIQSADLNQLGGRVSQIIDTSVGAGANQLEGVQFMLSDSILQQANKEALGKAVQDASAQGQTIASALGLRIIGVESVNPITPTFPPAYAADRSVPAALSTPIVPGSFTVTATVAVTYNVQ